MLAAVSEFWKDVGVYAATVIAVIGALGVLSRFRPIRFVTRTLVGEPLVGWITHAAVQPVVDAHSADVKAAVQVMITEHTSVEEQLVAQVSKDVASIKNEITDIKAEQQRVAQALALKE